jgi:uncharacterized protein YwqG
MLRGALRIENSDLGLLFETKKGETFELTVAELAKVYPDPASIPPAPEEEDPEPNGKQQKLQKIIRDFARQTSIPCISFSLTTKKTTCCENKFGGVPYIPKDFDYPLDAENNPMLLLAQLNFEKLPKLEGLPDKGILQFFISAKRAETTDNGVVTSPQNVRVIYHSEVNTKKNALGTPPSVKKLKKDDFPLKGEFALVPKIKNCPMSPSDFRFEAAFVAFFNKKTGKALKTIEQIEEFCNIEFYEEYGEIGGHRVGGFPMFTQGDPRNKDEYKKHTVLLLQIDSDKSLGKSEINWGNNGVANFFITPEALEKLDFTGGNVIYSRNLE